MNRNSFHHGNNPLSATTNGTDDKPITWVTVGEWAASGIVGWVAAQAFSRLFTNGQKIDFSSLISELVAEMQKLIKKEINRNELRKLNADINLVTIEMAGYNTNPNYSPRLENARQVCLRTLVHLETFGLAGHHSYLIASQLYLSILQSIIDFNNANKFDSTPEKANLMMALDRFETKLVGIHRKYYEWSDARFSGPIKFRPDLSLWTYFVNGKNSGRRFRSPQDALAKMNLHIGNERHYLHQRFITPSLHILEKTLRVRTHPKLV